MMPECKLQFEVQTERDRIRTVAQRWDEQYRYVRDPGKLDISKRLHALPLETATAAEVDAIIGNSTWTRAASCDVCGSDKHQTVAVVGEPPCPESRTVWICPDCVDALYHRMMAEKRDVPPPLPEICGFARRLVETIQENARAEAECWLARMHDRIDPTCRTRLEPTPDLCQVCGKTGHEITPLGEVTRRYMCPDGHTIDQ